ncbi:MAG: hypothetical protein HY650_10820, partial [Acidobacteria bacterium]|nr:hypothetical protein [Acidobacteriota bacterium]
IPAHAGQVIIDGTDANDHGSFDGIRNVDGWLYMQKVLENLASQQPFGVAKVVVDLGTTSGQARAAIVSAFDRSSLAGSGWMLRHVDGPADIANWLDGLSAFNTGILYIPTAGNSAGDLTGDELAAINARATKIRDFLRGGFDASRGGSLFAQGESLPGSYGWLSTLIPGIAVTDLGSGGIGTPITLTPDGAEAFPGLSNADLAGAVPWHNYFDGSFGSLTVFGTALDNGGIRRNVIVGGSVLAPTRPTVEVIRPEEGETINADSVFRIRWSSFSNFDLLSHRILLSTDGRPFDTLEPVAVDLPGDRQFFDWPVTRDKITDQAKIRVIARDIRGGEGQGDSGIFGIVNRQAPSGNERTIVLVHGIGQGEGDLRMLEDTLRGALRDSRYTIDSDFGWGECADIMFVKSFPCLFNKCRITNGAQKLAGYINALKDAKNIIIVGYSMGGLLARDVVLNNRLDEGRRVLGVITLGTPNAGYPFCSADRNIFCPTLLDDMASNFRSRQDEDMVVLSEYLSDLNSRWGLAHLPQLKWLAAAGTFCDNPRRRPALGLDLLCLLQGCRDSSPLSDDLICEDSALFKLVLSNSPTDYFSNRGYVHTHTAAGLQGLSLMCSADKLSTQSLDSPGVRSLLIMDVVRFINGL